MRGPAAAPGFVSSEHPVREVPTRAAEVFKNERRVGAEAGKCSNRVLLRKGAGSDSIPPDEFCQSTGRGGLAGGSRSPFGPSSLDSILTGADGRVMFSGLSRN